MRWNICNFETGKQTQKPWRYTSPPMAIFRNMNIFGDIFFYCIFVVTYCHLCPPPPPDRWSTKHFSSCSSWGRSCRWASKLLAEVQVQILMNFCRRQVLPPFDQFILLSPLNLQVLTFCTRSWLTDPLAKMVFLWDFVFSLVLLMGTTYGWKIQSKQQVSM